MKYPTNKCYFCDGELAEFAGTTETFNYCRNEVCYDKHHYTAGRSITFDIEQYGFAIYNDGKMSITQPRLQFDQTLEITTDNYLVQVERIKKLQVFK